MKVLELSRQKDDEQEMLPAIAYVLNFYKGGDLAEPPVTVSAKTLLKPVLKLMDHKSIREIAGVDDSGVLIGTLEAKNILAHDLHAKAEVVF